MALPTILVDDEKCHDPLSCRKCLLVCPTRVLGLGTSVGPEKFKQIGPAFFVGGGAGRAAGELPCHVLCLSSFEAAAQKIGDGVEMEVLKSLPQDGVCQFSFQHA